MRDALQERAGNQGVLRLRRALQRQAKGSAPDWIRAQLGIGAAEEAGAAALDHAETLPVPTGGEPLPAALQARAERETGVSLAGVTVARGADQACDAMGAVAFATPSDGGGHTVALSSGVDLASDDGRFTLMHELAHVAQQRRGETAGLSGLGGDEQARGALEAAADSVAAQSARLRQEA